MIKKRSKFWTVAFSMMPGAGHMFNGFMKKGVSIMGIFFILWLVASWMNLGALGLLTPVVWFYAFFDCINMRFQDDEEFYMQEDNYLFDKNSLKGLDLTNERTKKVIGVGLIIVGAYALWNNVIMHFTYNYGLVPEPIMQVLQGIGYTIPQVIVGVLIIWVGLELIRGKKKELERQDEEPSVYRNEAEGQDPAEIPQQEERQ